MGGYRKISELYFKVTATYIWPQTEQDDNERWTILESDLKGYLENTNLLMCRIKIYIANQIRKDVESELV